MSVAFKLDHAHVKGDASKPAEGSAVTRPHDTTMDRYVKGC